MLTKSREDYKDRNNKKSVHKVISSQLLVYSPGALILLREGWPTI